MNSTSVTIQGVEAKPGVSKKTGKPYTKYDIQTSGGTFGTFNAAVADFARNAPGATAILYEENQYGRDLKSLTIDPTATPAVPYVEPVRSQTPSGEVDWDMIGLHKTRCALWAAALAAGMTVDAARAAVLAAEVDIFHRPPASATEDLPF